MTNKCIICNEIGKGPLSQASATSLETIKTYCENWTRLGQKMEVYKRVKDLIFHDDTKHHYHRNCYQCLCHADKLARAQKKYEADVTSASHKKRGGSDVEASSSKQRKTFDESLCVFCQDDDRTAVVHSVTSYDMGRKFLDIKDLSKSENTRARLAFLDNEKDAFAQNMKYHINCLRKETRYVEKYKSSVDSTEEQDRVGIAISDIEIINIVRSLIMDSTESNFPSLDMNSINATYKSLLTENGVALDLEKNYKRHIKNLLLEEIPEIDFAKRGPKPEIVFSVASKDKLMGECFEHYAIRDELDLLYKASQIVRREISEMTEWNFSGSFNDFTTPLKLQQFMKWVISGPHTNLNVKKELQIERSSQNLAQHVISSYRSRRQLNYIAKGDSKFQKDKKTPLTVGLALTSYQANRSKSDVEMLNDLQLAVNYEDVERTTTRMALSIIDDMQTNTQGTHMPPFVKEGIRPLFAIDNVDLGCDSGSFHGADLLIAQKKNKEAQLISKDLKLNLNVKDRALKKSLEMNYYECDKPCNPVVSHTGYQLGTLKRTSTDFERYNITWLLMCGCIVAQAADISREDSFPGNIELLNVQAELASTESLYNEFGLKETCLDKEALAIEEHGAQEHLNISQEGLNCEVEGQIVPNKRASKKSPTWSTFNSLISDSKPKWNVGIVAPLYRRSPTEWPTLLTILKQAQKINCVIVGEGQRPIITLDGDLYDRAVKLKDYKLNWCIRLGALHITMAALKCLGKYVEGSGIDLAWEATGVYGSATVRQILDGRHIYRCIEAHTLTLIAVFTLYLEKVFSEEEKSKFSKHLNQAIDAFSSYADGKQDSVAFKSQMTEVQLALSACSVYQKLNESKEHGKGIQRFLSNYIDQVQVLLMFIAATRTCNWKLHLAKLEEMLAYFHAHDQYNYGRWGPLYVADMLEMQSTDPDTWKFLDDGNFAINKNSIPFTAIDPDHSIEQEHKKMKIKGGFIGITGNEHALEKYFIIAPMLSQVVSEFKNYAGIKKREPSSLHHEVVGSKSQRMILDAAKIVTAISKQGNPFFKNDMFNLVTFAVVPGNVSKQIEERDKMGHVALEKFVSSRMVEQTVRFWDPQKKNNWSYFKDVGATVQTKVGGQLVSIKQERKLLSRLLVAAKSRPDFVIKDAIGDFEFSVTPPSNFYADGSMIMLSDKSQLVSSVLRIPLPEDTTRSEPVNNAPSVLIIDAMCVVNMVTKTPDMSTAKHYAQKFVDILARMSASYDEIRIVFDQYISDSLKETTREKRTLKTTPIHYHVNDDTEIKSIKAFLAHIKTKGELTKFLCDKLMCYYREKPQRVIVMHHNTMEANCPLSDVISMPEMAAGNHALEEGDQLVILNAFDVMHKNPDSKLDVYSLDTDVFVLLTSHYSMLPKSTTLLRRKGEKISIQESYMRLGQKRAEALIGWYAFKGTDSTGSFAGKGVLSNFKAFLEADENILDAFAAFGVTFEVPDWIIAQMERYLWLLYKTGDIPECSVRELRWALFAQKGKEGQQLPPTSGTLIPHSHRAYYMALVWKTSRKPNPQLPPPTCYYWKSVDNQLKPVYSVNDPAPESLLQLRKCTCKTGCVTKACGCRNNVLKCTDMCGCGDGCKNMITERPLESDDDE